MKSVQDGARPFQEPQPCALWAPGAAELRLLRLRPAGRAARRTQRAGQRTTGATQWPRTLRRWWGMGVGRDARCGKDGKMYRKYMGKYRHLMAFR